MTWPHFIDFLTVLFWSSAILLFLGRVHDDLADRRKGTTAHPVAASRPVAAVSQAAGDRVPSPRCATASTSHGHDSPSRSLPPHH